MNPRREFGTSASGAGTGLPMPKRRGQVSRDRARNEAASMAEVRLRANHPEEWRKFYDAARVEFRNAFKFEYARTRSLIFDELVEARALRDGRTSRLISRPASERRTTCPKCDAEPGKPCTRPGGKWSKTHVARLKLNEQDEQQ